MSDLLPCPFCGGEAEWKSGGPGSAWVSCKSCPAETGDGAIPRIRDAWNTRALPAVQPDAAGLSAGGGAVGPFRHDPRDWTEDYAQENGNYMCLCGECWREFFGYKRRVTCKTCATKGGA